MEQDIVILPEYLSSPPVFSEVRVAQCLAFCVVFCRSLFVIFFFWQLRSRRVRDRTVVGFTTTYAISVNHHWCCEFESRSGRGVQHYVIKFVSDLRQVGGYFPGPPVSSTNKSDRHDITEILLKVALNQPNQPISWQLYCLSIFNLRLLITTWVPSNFLFVINSDSGIILKPRRIGGNPLSQLMYIRVSTTPL